MEAEAISIDEYLSCEREIRFDFLYENFPVLLPMIRNYKEELITDVIEMKLCNRRSENGDLGVRVQVSIGKRSKTEQDVIAGMSIEAAIDKGSLDESFFEDTDDRQELIRRVTLYHTVTADYESFKKKLNELEPEEQNILKPYLLRQKTLMDLASELDIDYRSVIKKVYRIKKKLSARVAPRLRERRLKYGLQER